MKKIIAVFVLISILVLSVISSFAIDPDSPIGANEDIISSTGGEYVEFVLDYTDRNLLAYNIDVFHIRVYCPYSVDYITLGTEKKKEVFKYELPDDAKRWWTDVEFMCDSESLVDKCTIGDLGGEDGKLTKLILRFHKTKDKEETVYIDSITLTEREKDTVPPIIDYNGSLNLSVTAEKPFELKDLTCYDAYERRFIDIEYIYPDGVAIDEFGCPAVGGPYDCLVKATDLSGNETSLNFKLTVRPRDEEAPIIFFDMDEITVPAGTIIDTNAVVSDNEDEVDCVAKWSKKSLDGYGRLLEGDHELTLTCTDLTGNKSKKVITVHVVNTTYSSSVDPSFLITRDESEITFPDDVIPYVAMGATVILIAIIVLILVVYLRKKAKKEKVPIEI